MTRKATMPVNIKYGARTAGLAKMKLVRKLVAEEGMDAPAEERIVYRFVQMRGLPPEGWMSTEYIRSRIRKVQGRKKNG